MYQRITITIEARHDGRLRIIDQRESILLVEAAAKGEVYDRLSVDEAVDVLDQLIGTTADSIRAFFSRHGSG